MTLRESRTEAKTSTGDGGEVAPNSTLGSWTPRRELA